MKWIKVTDRLPKQDRVLIYVDDMVYTSWYAIDNFYLRLGDKITRNFVENVTHWMPLPEPPTE